MKPVWPWIEMNIDYLAVMRSEYIWNSLFFINVQVKWSTHKSGHLKLYSYHIYAENNIAALWICYNLLKAKCTINIAVNDHLHINMYTGHKIRGRGSQQYSDPVLLCYTSSMAYTLACIWLYRWQLPSCNTLFSASCTCWYNTGRVACIVTEWVWHRPVKSHRDWSDRDVVEQPVGAC